MISSQWSHLYWTKCKEELMGYPPGTLVIVGHECGGGFAGAPERLTVAKLSGCKGPAPKEAEWPMPSESVEYVIGGQLFSGYNYFKGQR